MQLIDKSRYHRLFNLIAKPFSLAILIIFSPLILAAAPIQAPDLSPIIKEMKNDARGPFQSIQWFCPDGSILPARTACPTPGGYQHGLLKDKVKGLEASHGIYLNTVLAGLPHDQMWDQKSAYSRLKQYLLIQYLVSADNGWIYRKAKNYRGAIQVEDENNWGRKFLTAILKNTSELPRAFFLVREACRGIPHFKDNDGLNNIRAISKELSEKIPDFMEIRIKLHGNPEPSDIQKVERFATDHQDTFTLEKQKLFERLIKNLEIFFEDNLNNRIDRLITDKLRKDPHLEDPVKRFLNTRSMLLEKDASFVRGMPNPHALSADLLMTIRKSILNLPPEIRLQAMDLSLELEKLIMVTVGNWKPATLAELMEKCSVLIKASAGCGYIELWEWEQALNLCCDSLYGKSVPHTEFNLKIEQLRRIVDWGTRMIRSSYAAEILSYSKFEPKTDGFADDRIRSSVLLSLGDSTGELTRHFQALTNHAYHLPENINTGEIRGLNPGITLGILEVVGPGENLSSLDPEKIYVFRSIPSELKPVAGILSVSEGNLVSHIQLLARNLGIPNAVISNDNAMALESLEGRHVFFAVSRGGSVVLKPEEQMTEAERSLVQARKQKTTRIRVPIEKLVLKKKALLRLSQVSARDSGRICGPKAANLGQLKHLFPQMVSEGIILPFGIFRAHMDQIMPGTNQTFWQFLVQALSSRTADSDPKDDSDTLEKLAILRSAIQSMTFLPGFEATLEQFFLESLGKPLGLLPVFIRSDTNMEDLKEFTGAGLNLTRFNVLNPSEIFQGIRDVWASPYSERSFKWRQKYLENPENVFPSILLLPSVNVDASGVVITHGIVTQSSDDVTIAFNRGAGGAVEGQNAESYLMLGSGRDILLAPSRESSCTRLPVTGGIIKEQVLFDQPILYPEQRLKLRELVRQVLTTLPVASGIEGKGPFDIELGFLDNNIHLFQIRPFVENKNAGNLIYLQNLDAGLLSAGEIDMDMRLPLNGEIQ